MADQISKICTFCLKLVFSGFRWSSNLNPRSKFSVHIGFTVFYFQNCILTTLDTDPVTPKTLKKLFPEIFWGGTFVRHIVSAILNLSGFNKLQKTCPRRQRKILWVISKFHIRHTCPSILNLRILKIFISD